MMFWNVLAKLFAQRMDIYSQQAAPNWLTCIFVFLSLGPSEGLMPLYANAQRHLFNVCVLTYMLSRGHKLDGNTAIIIAARCQCCGAGVRCIYGLFPPTTDKHYCASGDD